MKTAWLNLRHQQSDRAESFVKGLTRLGYKVERQNLTISPNDGDVYVGWNRIGQGDEIAKVFEHMGNAVLIAENSAWGNGFAGRKWLALAKNRHNTVGKFPVFGPERWDSLNVELQPWRTEGETVILAQRGIGSKGTAMPREWPEQALKKYGGRIRRHPGNKPAAVILQDDLRRCGRVVTWGSGSALLALMWGIPVTSEMPNWIGACENTDQSRLGMFRALAWAQTEIHEIEDGTAFARLLDRKV